MYINFEFKNGGNPYIAKTDKELFRMVKKYILEQTGEKSFRVICPAEYWSTTGRELTSRDKGKTALREFAALWSINFSDYNYSWCDLYDWSEFFAEYGKKYGLLREFRENAIC